MLPDGDYLTHIQSVVVQLGDEDGSHSLVEGRAVHVDGGPDGQDKARYPLVDAVVFFGTAEGDGQGGRARGMSSRSMKIGRAHV